MELSSYRLMTGVVAGKKLFPTFLPLPLWRNCADYH
jgi:hypothetical protein